MTAGGWAGQGLFDAVLALASDLDLNMVLRRIVESACDLTGCSHAGLGVIGADGELDEFVHTGLEDDAAAAVAEAVKGDAAAAPPGALCVPIKGRDATFGNLYLSGTGFDDARHHTVEALAAAAAVAVENARMYARASLREQRLAAVREITATMLAEADTAEILRLVCHHTLLLLDVEVASVMLLADPEPDHLVIAASEGTNADVLVGRHMAIEGSLSGQVVRTGEPVIVGDIVHTEGVDHGAATASAMQRALIVPMESADRRIGCLAMGRSPGARRFRQEDLEVAQAFGAQAALVIEFARSRRQVERLAVVEDRERIARDLHDRIVQSLFSIAIKLQSVERQIGDPAAAARVQHAVDSLDKTVRDIRSAIFALESVRTAEQTVRRDLLAITERSAAALGFPPRVRLEGPIDDLPDDLARDLLAAVQEALSNVAKHARATAVDLEVCVDGAVVVRVVDDGVGLDRAAPRADGGGSGLRNLEARARRWGGSFTARPTSGSGTLVEWTVPVPGAPAPA